MPGFIDYVIKLSSNLVIKQTLLKCHVPKNRDITSKLLNAQTFALSGLFGIMKDKINLISRHKDKLLTSEIE